jgi:hypothetical protein
MRERCGDRLPRFTAEQRAMLMGSVDFFGLNHYSSHLCEQPAWYKELAPQQDEEEREGKLVRYNTVITLLCCGHWDLGCLKSVIEGVVTVGCMVRASGMAKRFPSVT